MIGKRTVVKSRWTHTLWGLWQWSRGAESRDMHPRVVVVDPARTRKATVQDGTVG